MLKASIIFLPLLLAACGPTCVVGTATYDPLRDTLPSAQARVPLGGHHSCPRDIDFGEPRRDPTDDRRVPRQMWFR